MADQNLYELWQEFLQNIFGNQAVAAQVAADPYGALAAHGITGYDDEAYRQAVADTYDQYDLPYGNKEVLDGYAKGYPEPDGYPVKAPAPDGQYPSGAEAAAHNVQYTLYAAYEQQPEITQEIVNNNFQFLQVDVDQSTTTTTTVDNSLALDLQGAQVQGDVDISPEVTNITAAGERSVAGENNQAATGDGAIVGDGNQQFSGDNSQFVGGDNDGILLSGGVGPETFFAPGADISGNVSTGDVGPDAFFAPGADISGPVNTGNFTGNQAADDIQLENSAQSFADGDATTDVTQDSGNITDSFRIEDSFNNELSQEVSVDGDNNQLAEQFADLQRSDADGGGLPPEPELETEPEPEGDSVPDPSQVAL